MIWPTGVRVADYVINQKGTLDPGELTAGLLLVLLPGMVVAFGLWFAMLALFRHGGVGGTLASMNAREPNQADLKELQLADTAQEMAIAAGLPAPQDHAGGFRRRECRCCRHITA